eukprot:6185239-Pleurochrysis_carterae.AAC.3
MKGPGPSDQREKNTKRTRDSHQLWPVHLYYATWQSASRDHYVDEYINQTPTARRSVSVLCIPEPDPSIEQCDTPNKEQARAGTDLGHLKTDWPVLQAVTAHCRHWHFCASLSLHTAVTDFHPIAFYWSTVAGLKSSAMQWCATSSTDHTDDFCFLAKAKAHCAKEGI